MIFTSQSPISPEVEVEVTGVDFDFVSIQQMTLELGENKHDSLRIKVTGIPPKKITQYLMAPIKVRWAHNQVAYQFSGYITYVEPEHVNRGGLVNGSPFQVATLYCFGASFDMKQKKNQVWHDATLATLVSQMAARYRYSFSIPKDEFVFTRVVQSGESDWEFLTRVVHQLGYSVTVHGTHIHVFDRYRALYRRNSYSQITVPARTSGKLQSGQIMEVKGIFGYVTPYANLNRENLVSVDNRGRRINIKSTRPGGDMGDKLPSLFEDDLAKSSLSASYARRKLRQRQRDKFPFKANLSVTGITGVLPGGVINLQDFDSQFDGFWYVTEVTQILTRDKYITELEVIKDTFSPKVKKASSTKETKPPKSVLRAKKWQAANQRGTTHD